MLTSCNFVYQTRRGFLRKSCTSLLPISIRQVHCTSLAVNGLPSCHFTPCRSLKVSLVLVESQDQLSARSGITVSRLSWTFAGSKTTRLLKTAANGVTEAMVDSSSREALGGLSLWYSRRTPPLFCEAAGVAASRAMPSTTMARNSASQPFYFYRAGFGSTQCSPHPEERPLGRVSKDGHTLHGSRRAKTRSSP